MRIAHHRGWTVIVALLVALPVAGCGNMGEENAALATSAIKASDARLKIYRTSNLVASAGAASVKLDGREVASLGIGGSTMLDIPAGAHKSRRRPLGPPQRLHHGARCQAWHVLHPRGLAAHGGSLRRRHLRADRCGRRGGGKRERQRLQIRVVDAVAIKRSAFLGRQTMKARMAAATSSGLSSSARWPAPAMIRVSVLARMASAIVRGVAPRHQRGPARPRAAASAP